MKPDVTIYKQKPGADIDPGWWAVIHPQWWDIGARARWLGPYPRRQAAKAAANAACREIDFKARQEA